MQSFSQVIRLWPSRSELAADCGVPYGHVQQWERRESVPAEYWHSLVAAAARRGYPGITAATLAEIAARRRAG